MLPLSLKYRRGTMPIDPEAVLKITETASGCLISRDDGQRFMLDYVPGGAVFRCVTSDTPEEPVRLSASGNYLVEARSLAVAYPVRVLNPA